MTPYAALCTLLKDASGLALGEDKLYLVETRLAPVMRQHGLKDLAALADRARRDHAVAEAVVEAMTTNETLFFRDNKPFQHLRNVTFPRLHGARPAGAPLRIWSAAASSGQEAYSIAMLICEMGAALGGRRAVIEGTDIAREQIARAQHGSYTQFEVQRGMPTPLLLRYFEKDGASWRIRAPIRDMVRFRSWNLLSDLRPLGQFDVVFCRNVLIYFDVETKARILQRIAAQMAPDGVLYLGGAESASGLCDALKLVEGEHSVFALASSAVPSPRLTMAAF